MAKQPDRFGGEAMSTRLIPSPTVSAAMVSDLPLVGDEYSPRWGLAAAALDDKVYLFGGYIWYHGAELFHGDFYEVDTRQMTIRSLPMRGPTEGYPRPRFGHTLVAIPSRKVLLMYGGRDAEYCFTELWQYSIVDGLWSLIAPLSSSLSPERMLPVPRSWHSCNIVGNSMYVIGGWGQDSEVLGDVWKFDLESNTWKALSSPNGHRLRSPEVPHNYVSADTSVSDGGTGGLMDTPGRSMNEYFANEGRACHQGVIWRNSIYVYGGVIRGNTESGPELLRFDLDTLEWSSVRTFGCSPGKRVSMAGTLVDDTWILHGGMTSMPGAMGKTTSDIFQFDFLSSTWTRKLELCLSSTEKVERSTVLRYGHAATTLSNGTPVFFGGAESYASASSSSSWRIEFIPSVGQIRELTGSLAAEKELLSREMRMLSEQVKIANDRTVEAENDSRYWERECGLWHDRWEESQKRMEGLHHQLNSLRSAFQQVQPVLSGLKVFASTLAKGGSETPAGIAERDFQIPTDRYGSAPARPLHSNNPTNSPVSQPIEASHLG